MLDNGYIKLHRTIQKDPIWTRAIYLRIWLYCLLNANIQDKELIVDGKAYRVPRGSFVTSYRNIVSECSEEGQKMSLSTVKRVMDYLCTERMLERTSRADFTHITVVNYTSYQGQKNAKANTERTLREHQENESKKDKNDKKNIDKRTLTKEDYRLIADYFVIAESFVKQTHEKILDYETAKYGGEYYKDMRAAIRNWIRRSIDRNEVRQGEIVAQWK